MTGVSFALRKIGKLAKPELTITVNGNNIKMKSVSTFRTFEAEANVGEEFDETTPDGRKVKVKTHIVLILCCVIFKSNM